MPAEGYSFVKEAAARLGVKPEDIDTMDVGDVFMLSTVFHAFRGSPSQMREVLDRLDGPARPEDGFRLTPEAVRAAVEGLLGAEDPRVAQIAEQVRRIGDRPQVVLEYE